MAKEPVTLAHILDPNLHRANLPVNIEDIRYPNGIVPPEVVEVAAEVAEKVLEPLYLYGVQVTFFKLYIIIWLSIISVYAIGQGNKEKVYRDCTADVVGCLVLFTLLSFMFSIVTAVLFEIFGIVVPIP